MELFAFAVLVFIAVMLFWIDLDTTQTNDKLDKIIEILNSTKPIQQQQEINK